MIRRIAFALALLICLLPLRAFADEYLLTQTVEAEHPEEYARFLLVINDGLTEKRGETARSTALLLAVSASRGKARLAAFAPDLFIDYKGYKERKRLDAPFQLSGVTKLRETVNRNFAQQIENHLSCSWIHFAQLLDAYGKYSLDISPAEKKELNKTLAAAKKGAGRSKLVKAGLDKKTINALFKGYKFSKTGASVKMTGLQAAAVCLLLEKEDGQTRAARQNKCADQLIENMLSAADKKASFYSAETEKKYGKGKKKIDLDAMAEEDLTLVREIAAPLAKYATTTLEEGGAGDLLVELLRARDKSRALGEKGEGFLQRKTFPVESGAAKAATIGDASGREADLSVNARALNEFLYGNG